MSNLAARSMRRPRVLLVAPQTFFALRGTPINVLQMLRTLCAAGCAVDLATYGVGCPVEIDGLTHYRAPTPAVFGEIPIGFSWRKVLLDGVLALTVCRLLLTRRYDVVHAVEESIFFALPAAKLRRLPIIYDLDSFLSHQLEYSHTVRSPALLWSIAALERAALRRATIAITVCQALTDRVRAVNESIPIFQIEDCPLEESVREPDLELAAELRERFGVSGAPLAVYTGNLETYQGIDLLLDSLTTIAAHCPQARLLIAGGEQGQIDTARTALASRGIDHLVVFAGKQPASLMAEFMAMADVLVSPRTQGENTPLKLYSYMSSGVPIVATDLPTHTQILDRKTAVLCPPSPAAFGDAVATVLAAPEQYSRIGKAARERVLRDYSSKAFAAKLIAAYRRVLPNAFPAAA